MGKVTIERQSAARGPGSRRQDGSGTATTRSMVCSVASALIHPSVRIFAPLSAGFGYHAVTYVICMSLPSGSADARSAHRSIADATQQGAFTMPVALLKQVKPGADKPPQR